MGKENIKKLNRIILNLYGIIFVIGFIGSGKLISLYLILSELNFSSVNIIIVEDFVEYIMNGIN